MHEFPTRPTEAIPSEEVERAVALANYALPNPQPDINGRIRKWEKAEIGNDEHALLVERQNSDGYTYLIGLRVVNPIDDLQDADVTMYVLTSEISEFMTIRGNSELFASLGAYGEDEVSKDFQNLLFEMGDFHPLENDWNDFMSLIIEAGKEADWQDTGTEKRIPITWVDKAI